ncbi:hypothetical protein BOH66_13885 [Microbacterium aurum]|uniref:protein-tyrosine-phosphatase n=1 Tax=Microbacterium aurum TaxID=36805 RepID=A0A1P8UAV2_9MICO|nr:hypothetical protein [Microbacterium aurum]APZ35215.1 hypothetical protein BOH66_13885 [Microbacterium aurum]MBM7829192.1 protein-tyrosine phosphatase [Microbacterium aurum]
MTTTTTPRAEVLLVCRANQCRSPFAQAIATRLGAARGIHFSSAGLLPGGNSTPATGRAVAHKLGFDLEHHRSRQVDAAQLDRYDLILTMGRDQARDLLIERDDIWPRLFTLKQFTRWAPAHPRPPRTTVGGWLDAGLDRPRHTVIGADPADDVADPMGSPARAWRRMATELDTHLRIVVDALATPTPSSALPRDQSTSSTARS